MRKNSDFYLIGQGLRHPDVPAVNLGKIFTSRIIFFVLGKKYVRDKDGELVTVGRTFPIDTFDVECALEEVIKFPQESERYLIAVRKALLALKTRSKKKEEIKALSELAYSFIRQRYIGLSKEKIPERAKELLSIYNSYFSK